MQASPNAEPLIPAELRFKAACKMLRDGGYFDRLADLPGQRRGESPIDWLVRLGLAPSPQVAAEMLILGAECRHVLDSLTGPVEYLPPGAEDKGCPRAGGPQSKERRDTRK